MRRIAVLIVIALGALVGAPVTSQAVPTPPLPRSMAAIGDSMTQAADVCCWYGDHPANSWSTGGAGWDGIRSHYERLRALNPAITGRNHNDAVSGARMSDGPAQAQRAVDQGVQYVTVLMGANDVCTATPESMTDVETFRTQLQQTLDILENGLSGRARYFVASIPDVHRLWEIFQGDPVARFVWDVADICQSLLAPARSPEQRRAVQDHNIALNVVLAEECAARPRCRFDRNAVFDFRFEPHHVSKLDYFHPSLAGQAALAEATWRWTWWGPGA